MAKANKNGTIIFFLIPVGGMLIALVLSGLITQFLLLEEVTASFTSVLAGNQTEQFVSYFDQKQNQVQAQLDAVARSPDLIQLLLQHNEEDLQREAQRLVSLIPGAISVRLIPLGKAKVDRDSVPAFSYAGLDMVNRVEQGKKVFAEAVNFEGRQILMMAQAVSMNNQVIGTLFIFIEMSALTADLAMSHRDGKIILRQQFGQAEPTELFQIGSESSKALVVTRSLASPIWEIEYTPSRNLFSSGMLQPATFWLPVIVLFLISLLTSLFAIWRFNVTITNQTKILGTQIRAAFKGSHKISDLLTLPGMRAIDSMLDKLQSTSRIVQPGAGETVAPKLPITETAETDSDLEDVDTEEAEDRFEGSPVEVDDSALASIFRAYDIRGIVNETLTGETIYRIGQAIASELLAEGASSVIVGADGRVSSPAVSDSLIRGLIESGINVTDIGTVPSPVLYYATEELNISSAVMITASHNPPEYNGFKILINGVTLGGERIQKLYQQYLSGEFPEGKGTLNRTSVVSNYVDSICDDIVIAQPLNIVIDCGNGVTGSLAPELFSNLGCDVTPLYCEVDGNFPHHDPDPTNPANLEDLILAVTSSGADLGIAFDGDGDRMVVVTNAGNIIWPDRLLMLFTRDIVSRNPGADVIFDVKCTKHLTNLISSLGGRPIMCRSGHSFLKAKMQETGALLGGEMSGHICFKERWNGFDDGLYGAARLLEIVGAQTKTIEELFDTFPKGASTAEIKIPIADNEKFGFMDALSKSGDFGNGVINDLDGLRVDYKDGWGLIRASNTTPNLTLRFEADQESGLQRIKQVFREQIHAINEGLPIDF